MTQFGSNKENFKERDTEEGLDKQNTNPKTTPNNHNQQPLPEGLTSVQETDAQMTPTAVGQNMPKSSEIGGRLY